MQTPFEPTPQQIYQLKTYYHKLGRKIFRLFLLKSPNLPQAKP